MIDLYYSIIKLMEHENFRFNPMYYKTLPFIVYELITRSEFSIKTVDDFKKLITKEFNIADQLFLECERNEGKIASEVADIFINKYGETIKILLN